MPKINIRFGGFGGQGVIMGSVVLGTAAMYEGKDVIQNQSYGQQARGGECMSELIISDDEILYPLVEEVDILLIMSQPALKKYKNSLKKGGCLILDPDLVKYETDRNDVEIINVPATTIATKLGSKIVANMVLLGALVEKTKVVSDEALKKGITDLVPPSMTDLNIKAADEGKNRILGVRA